MNHVGRWLGTAARIAALGATTCLLVATTAPLDPIGCEWTAPVTFMAEGTCGPGGLVVVDWTQSTKLRLVNAAALGLPPLESLSFSPLDPKVQPSTETCLSDYSRGGWEVVFPNCGGATDAGAGTVDTAGGGDSAVGNADAGIDAPAPVDAVAGAPDGDADIRDARAAVDAVVDAGSDGATGIGPDAGVDAGGDNAWCSVVCRATPADAGGLLFRCIGPQTRMVCQSRLTVVP